MNYNYM